MSRVKYCKANGINYGTFRNWLKNKKEEPAEWKRISIQEEPETNHKKNFFEFRIYENWKFEIILRIGNDFS